MIDENAVGVPRVPAARPKAVVIGASAGAVEALTAVLSELPADFPVPIIVVVHIPPEKTSVLADLFRAKCRLDVREVEDKEPLVAGTVYFAPPDYHVICETDDRLSLAADEPVRFSRPSIDVLFESAVSEYGGELVGIVLTGGNDDGARGLRAICNAGGVGLVQNPEEAYARFMPRAALEGSPDAHALSLKQIAEYLVRIP